MKIAEFFTNVPAKQQEGPAMGTTASNKQIQKINEVQENPIQMTVNLKVEMPDIILVEHMDSIDTNAMILNVKYQTNILLSF